MSGRRPSAKTKKEKQAMPLIATQTRSYDPIPEGLHLATCVAVIDLGTQEDSTYGRKARKVLLTWEVGSERIQLERDGKTQDLPRQISKTYTLSLSEKSTLRHDLEGWAGRALSQEELAGFDLARLVGKACQIQVIHKSKLTGGTFAKVETVVSLPKGFQADPPESPTTFFSLDDCGEDLPETLPEWVANQIRASEEWKRSEAAESVGFDVEDHSPGDKLPWE